MRNRGNGSQRFSAEAQCADMEKVFCIAQFAGGMAGDGQFHFFWDDAYPIIADLNEVLTSAFYANRNASGTGINGVFQQFLHNRSWPFHHFTGCDL
jgi:hypothetical protein